MRQHVQMPTKEVADFLVIILVYPLYVNQYISCLLTNTRIGGSVCGVYLTTITFSQ